MHLLLIASEPTPPPNWLRRQLEFDNNQVSVSPDWQSGIGLLHQSHYDAILVMMHLPETVDTAQTWSAKPPGVPLLVLISPDTPANKAWSLEVGADDCVSLSVDCRELRARIYALHRRKTGHFQPLSMLTIADLALHINEKTAYRAGRRIELLPREYELLLFLLENKGRVVSKKEIMEKAWCLEIPRKGNSVEVYINHLRTKIDRPSPTKLIHTVMGMGYILREANQ